jgi:phosphoadenosine phosphosulfate reductase
VFGPVDLDTPVARIRGELSAYRASGRRMFATSSFQTNSVVLLHLLAEHAPEVPVYFLDTGFHFPETHAFRRQLADRLGLDIRVAVSPVSRIQQRDGAGRLLFTSDPDRCCHLNKVLPLEPVLATHDLWISGIRGSQSENRASLGRASTGRHGVQRFHPLIDWNGRMVHSYIERHELPRHPLDDAGYLSIGCQPCTRRLVDDPGIGGGLDDRGGRWAGLKKTECGLHLPGGEA